MAMSDEGGSYTTNSLSASATGASAGIQQLLEMRRAIKEHLQNSSIEVIVVVEGIEPASSCTFMARHSYIASEIAFDETFEPCMSLATDGAAQLSWDLFHGTRPVAFNSRQIIGASHS